MRYLAVIALAILALPALAEQKYNPYSGEWETTTPDAQMEYNPYSGDHQYVPRPNGNEPKLEYNPYEDRHEFVPDTSPRSDDQRHRGDTRGRYIFE